MSNEEKINRYDGAVILALPMQDNDADAATIRDYLVALLVEVWADGEGFSGKRPFGNSGWSGELFIPLVKAGIIDGQLDEDDNLDDCDDRAGELAIHAAIKALAASPKGNPQ